MNYHVKERTLYMDYSYDLEIHNIRVESGKVSANQLPTPNLLASRI